MRPGKRDLPDKPSARSASSPCARSPALLKGYGAESFSIGLTLQASTPMEITPHFKAQGLAMLAFLREKVDERDIRDKLRIEVMALTERGVNAPADLLDQAMKVWRRCGMRAARAYIRNE